MLEQAARRQRDENQDMAADVSYLEGYRTAKNSDDFRHTAGNMGQLTTLTQEQMDHKKMNMSRLTEVWDKSAKVLQLKKQLHEE